MAFVIYGTLIPFDLRLDAETVERGRRHAHWTPFRIGDRLPSRTDLLGNLLLFGTLGFFLQGGLDPRARRPVAGVLAVTAFASVLSFGIEAAQLLSPSRVTSVTDWIVNSVGGLVGAVGGVIYSRLFSPWVGRWVDRHARVNPVLPAAAATACVLLVVGLVPFDVSIDMSDLARSVRGAILVPFQAPAHMTPGAFWMGQLTAALPWAAFAFLAGYAASNPGGQVRRPDRAAWAGMLASAGLCTAIECAQIASVTRVTDVTDVLVGVFGAALGALLCGGYVAGEPVDPGQRWAKARRLAQTALVVCVIAYLVDAASPYQFDWAGAGQRLQWKSLIPMYAYYEKTTLQAVQDFVGGVANLLPVGVLFALLRMGLGTPERRALRRLLWHAGLAAGLVAVAGEVCQIGLERVPDITDALTGIVGGVVGAWLWCAYARLVRQSLDAGSGPASDRDLGPGRPQADHGQ
jgi:glycopeptide antibiotics resistance protein